MAWNRKIKPVSVDDFFEKNSGKYNYETFAEKVYVMIHTYYLNSNKKIKVAMGQTWEDDFGLYMTDETFEYMLVNEPIMLRDITIASTRKKEEIKSNKYLEKSLVAFEFDLWLVENNRAGNALRMGAFDTYITERYGTLLDDKFRSFKKYDLRHIENFESLAKALDPYYEQIKEVFDLILSNNRMRIPFEKEYAERVVENKAAAKSEPVKEPPQMPADIANGSIADILASSKNRKNAEKEKQYDPEAVAEQPEKDASDKAVEDTASANISVGDMEREMQELRKKIDREYTLIIKDKDDRIDRLEKDIKEFKRQRDEAREYSVNQYDRGIKNLFSTMNDARYGKVIDYLYSLSRSDETEENLASYLDNLFMALEDMEIEPIIQDDEIVVNEETMLKEYNLDFNKTDFDKKKVRLKYAGWTYKDTTMEKPSITMTEE